MKGSFVCLTISLYFWISRAAKRICPSGVIFPKSEAAWTDRPCSVKALAKGFTISAILSSIEALMRVSEALAAASA